VDYRIGDSLDLMRQMPSKSVDLILTDPPYGIGESNEKNRTRGTKLSPPTDFGHFDWDTKRLEKTYFDEMERVSRNRIIFGGNYYTDYLPPSSCRIVWDKDQNNDFADCELAWTSFRKATRKIRYRWSGAFQEDMRRKEKRVYPTQKPIQVFVWILEEYTEPDSFILDPFVGSGTTLMACRMTGRRGLGFDKDPRCEKIIRKRMFADVPDITTFRGVLA
jgi:DNA modification methylase